MQLANRDFSSRIRPIFMMAVFALALLFGVPQRADAQLQWTNSTTNPNNIHNINTGNVGIGTTEPGAKLDLSTAANTDIRIGSTGTNNPYGLFRLQGVGSTPYLQIQAGDTLGYRNLILNNLGGNVGIGTIGPGAKLHSIDPTLAGLFMDLTLNTANSNTEKVLRLERLGEFGVTYGSVADFMVGRYESAGTAARTQLDFRLTHGSAVNPDTTIMSLRSSGNVGIGTTNPTSKLHVVSGTDSGTTLLHLDTGVHGGTALAVFGTPNNESGFDLSVYNGGAYFSRFGVDNYGRVYLQPAGGNVGIGTTAPAYRLDVQGGQINASGGLCMAGDCKVSWSQVAGGSGSTQWTTSGSNIYYSTGNVGIGTSAPARRLHVFGGNIESQFSTTAGQGYGFFIARDNNHFVENAYFDGTAWKAIQAGKSAIIQTNTVGGHALYVQADDTSRAADATRSFTVPFVVKTDGNVGIGTTSPGNKLTVSSAGGIADTLPALGYNGGKFALLNNGGAYGLLQGVLVNGNSFIQAQRVDGTPAAYHVLLQPNGGNVGIGTATPTAKLDVNGDINVTGNINAKYQDIAEWVPSTAALPPGTVVVLNPTKSNHVMASARAYDTSVAGVISEKPGLSLGEPGKDKVLVATTGRVRVKVSATSSPIHVGDLLVTSDIEGVAMKSEPVNLSGIRLHRPGTLIGKALEPLAKGFGEILVLLSLQ